MMLLVVIDSPMTDQPLIHFSFSLSRRRRRPSVIVIKHYC